MPTQCKENPCMPVGQRGLTSMQKIDGTPTKPGWYIARMKTRASYEGREIVRVTGSADNLKIWQPGDERFWEIDDFEWFDRIFP